MADGGQRRVRVLDLGRSFVLLPPRRRAAVGAGALLFVTGLVLALVNLLGGDDARPPTPPAPHALAQSPATPTRSSAAPTGTPTRPPVSTAKAAPFACARPRSRQVGVAPVGICIPHIRVQSTIMSLGLNADRTVQVPPLSRVRDAGWYRYSATPGSAGPTVILGHVDSARYGEGVFFHLGRLRHGDKVLVYRADGQVATFQISSVQLVSKSSFPSMKVYGPDAHPVLRLVTCGGRFDPSAGRYLDNIIAYGSLLSVGPG